MSEHPQERTKAKENSVYIVIKDHGQVYYRGTYHPPGDRVSVIRELLRRTYGEIPGNYTHEIHRIR